MNKRIRRSRVRGGILWLLTVLLLLQSLASCRLSPYLPDGAEGSAVTQSPIPETEGELILEQGTTALPPEE